jgi:tRNA 2-(methylsulfanyl)-N6-isopentenyladenosine37 hydroxylase
LIEARSAERFAALAPRLPAPLNRFYEQLHRSEARHFQLYLRLAIQAAQDSGLEWGERLEVLANREAELATTPDDQFRFHSGPP